MIQADATAAPPPHPAEIVVSRQDSSRLVSTQDLPLVLVKGARREEAVLRRAIFLTISVLVTKPAEDPSAENVPASYRWTYKSFLQRQLCVTSITGLFACSTAEVTPLPDVDEGQAPAQDDGAMPLADTARQRLEDGLKARADTTFAADRKTNFDLLLKAAGVRVTAAPRRSTGPPARGGRAAGGG